MAMYQNAVLDELRGYRPPNGNTGVAGGIPRQVQPAGAGGIESAPPMAQPAAPAAPNPVFQSANNSLGGYLQEAAAAYRPELIKIGDEAGRKSAAEGYIRSLEPELRKRGWGGGDIRNEKLQVDGRWMDLFRDIEGEAGAQYLDVTDSPAAAMGGGGMNPAFGQGMGGLNALLQGDPSARIQQALGGVQAPNFEALLAALSGGGR